MLAVELKDITKSFRGVKANDGVNLRVQAGSIHALVGENGAGKSTLMRILYGMIRPDSGAMKIGAHDVSFASPADAIALGIGMVHQHFMLIPEFTVTENIILGKEPSLPFGRIDEKRAKETIRNIIGQYGFNLDPDAHVRDLPVGIQQRVEILKILYRDASILILDEPTAVLTPQEIQELFSTIKLLRGQGKTIILITHKLNEIMDISDHVTVLRRGTSVFDVATASTTKEQLTHHMIGRELSPPPSLTQSLGRGRVLEFDHVFAEDKLGLPALSDISLSIDAGEVLGIAGVEGNGQMHLVGVLTGVMDISRGIVRLQGRNVSPDESFRNFAHIPEDRHKQGLVLDFSVEENMILGRQREQLFNSSLSLDYGRIAAFTAEIAKEYDVRSASLRQPVRGLSGGNQQKIVVGRELSKEVPFIIAAHPTRGLDIGATEFVHHSILAARQEGRAILLISSDLSEILTLSDRIAVMFKGEIVTTRAAGECTEYDLGLYMSGTIRKSA